MNRVLLLAAAVAVGQLANTLGDYRLNVRFVHPRQVSASGLRRRPFYGTPVNGTIASCGSVAGT
jgi:hypothetical protein